MGLSTWQRGQAGKIGQNRKKWQHKNKAACQEYQDGIQDLPGGFGEELKEARKSQSGENC